MKPCPACADLPGRRPVNSLCLCGKRWQAEAIRFHADGHHGTASAQGVSFEAISPTLRNQLVNGIWIGEQNATR